MRDGAASRRDILRLLAGGAALAFGGGPAATSAAAGSPFAIEPTFGTPFGVDDPPPVKTTISTTTIAMTTAAAPAPISTRGEACRRRGPPFDWTGGGALCARRFSLLFLPLAIAGKRSRVVAGAGSGKR